MPPAAKKRISLTDTLKLQVALAWYQGARLDLFWPHIKGLLQEFWSGPSPQGQGHEEL